MPIAVALGTSCAQQLQPLRPQIAGEKGHAGDIAARPIEAGDQTSLTGSLAMAKTIGIVVVAALATRAAGCSQRLRPPAGGSIRPPAPAADRD